MFAKAFSTFALLAVASAVSVPGDEKEVKSTSNVNATSVAELEDRSWYNPWSWNDGHVTLKNDGNVEKCYAHAYHCQNCGGPRAYGWACIEPGMSQKLTLSEKPNSVYIRANSDVGSELFCINKLIAFQTTAKDFVVHDDKGGYFADDCDGLGNDFTTASFKRFDFYEDLVILDSEVN